jgi:hypothetical protein
LQTLTLPFGHVVKATLLQIKNAGFFAARVLVTKQKNCYACFSFLLKKNAGRSKRAMLRLISDQSKQPRYSMFGLDEFG